MTASSDPRRRVLVIDDNEAIHGDFRKALGMGGAAPAAPGLAGAKAALFGGGGGDAAEGGAAAAAAIVAPATMPASFRMDSARQGQEGLAKVQGALREGDPYPVAFVDMRMPPGWDGLETIKRLWEVDASLEVVICTAYSDYSWEEITRRLGTSDQLLILKKPFDPVEVSQLAASLTAKWALKRQARLKLEEMERMVAERTAALTHASTHDRLTGLPNRVLVRERIAAAIERRRRNAAANFALFFLDFDRFKSVNDSRGHEVGDLLLVEIGRRLTDVLRWERVASGRGSNEPRSMAARLGGDEFVVLLKGIADAAHAERVAARLIDTLAEPYLIKGASLTCTASIGVTTGDVSLGPSDDVIRDADTAMYHAKTTGAGRYVLFDQSMRAKVEAELALENDLHGAVGRGELVLHYQPIVSLTSGRVEAMEALVRWNHPRRGMVPPLDFIPCCEETGMIVEVGYWVLGEALRQLRAWRAAFPTLADLTVSVNLSARQLAAPDLLTRVREALERTGLPPEALTLEITESAVVRETDAASGVLNGIRAMGVRLHMDDFGTGYSSLSCLHRLPLNGLKIDRSFVRNLSERRAYAAVVYAIVNLARNLGMKLIAEGIETAEQAAMLQSMECDSAQGYWIDRPRDARQAEVFLASQVNKSAA